MQWKLKAKVHAWFYDNDYWIHVVSSLVIKTNRYSCTYMYVNSQTLRTLYISHSLHSHWNTIGLASEHTAAHGDKATSTCAESIRCMANRIGNKVEGHVQVLKIHMSLREVMRALTIQQISIGHVHDYKKPPFSMQSASMTKLHLLHLHADVR